MRATARVFLSTQKFHDAAFRAPGDAVRAQKMRVIQTRVRAPSRNRPPRTTVMRIHSLKHLADETLIRDLTALVANDRTTTAVLVAHIAEMDVRRLFRPLGYSSMFRYCIGELGMS